MSRILCPAESFGLEAGLEQRIEVIERGFHVLGDAAPLAGLEGGDGDPEFEFRRFLGLEVSAAISPKNLELAVDRLGDVGSRKGTTDAIGVVEKREVVRSLLA